MTFTRILQTLQLSDDSIATLFDATALTEKISSLHHTGMLSILMTGNKVGIS